MIAPTFFVRRVPDLVGSVFDIADVVTEGINWDVDDGVGVEVEVGVGMGVGVEVEI
jgi:hypothetical protein